MKTKVVPLVGIAMMTVLLAACGGSDGSSEESTVDSTSEVVVESSAPPETAETATDEPPTTTTATVEQYASVVAEEKADLEEYIANVEECSLGGWEADSLLCPLTPLTLSAQASTLAVRFSDEARDDLRLDPPPAEIEDLVQRTREASQKVVETADIVNECSTYEECEAEWFDLQLATSELQGVIDAWTPYL